MGFEWGLEHGYGVFTWLDGSQYKRNWVYEKQHGKERFISDKGIEQEGIWENGKLHGFFIKAMQNSKSRFLHGSNGLPNKTNKYYSRRLFFCSNSGKTACQTV